MVQRPLVAAAALTLAFLAVSAHAAAYVEGVVLFTFADSRITESSGVVASSLSDDWFFTHNDSGDDARFFVVNRRGVTLATHTLPGVDSNDWEDIARGPDESGRSSLWLGDIGDNAMMRPEIAVYRVPEPAVDPARRGVELRTPAPARFILRYEDAAHDAETLLVHPTTGRLYIVTKTYVGQASLYAAPERLVTTGPNTLTRVADLVFTTTGTPGGAQFGPGANLATTGGDIAPRGDRLVIRTYTDAYEWQLDGTDVGAALQPTRPRTRTALPATAQGEAITYTRDGRSLLVTTEGRNAPAHLLRGEVAAAPSASASTSASTSSAPSPAASPADADADAPTDSPRRELPRSGLLDSLPAAAAVLAAVGVAATRLRRSSPNRHR